jgi:hypothetical protein
MTREIDAERMRLWAGHGTGARCHYCHHPIEATQVEYEVERLDMTQSIAAGTTNTGMRFHVPCHKRWRDETRR